MSNISTVSAIPGSLILFFLSSPCILSCALLVFHSESSGDLEDLEHFEAALVVVHVSYMLSTLGSDAVQLRYATETCHTMPHHATPWVALNPGVHAFGTLRFFIGE